MKKVLTLLALSSLVSFNVYASEVENEAEHESKFYIAAKGLVTLGSSIEEETSTLKGSTGKGLGIDLGYRIGKGFAVEIDATYATNTVTETKANGDKEDFTGTYITTSLDLIYAYKVTPELEAFVKGGLEYEIEKINGLNIDSSSTGFSYAAGAEYEVTETMAILAEYEGTTIDGPRGNAVFVGVTYNF